MEKTSKKLVIVSILIATIITGIGVAFGYFIWNSTSNTDISFTVSGAVVQLDDGSDITGANLMPVASYTSGGKNVVKKDIKIKLKDTTSDTVTVDFKLKVNSIDSGLNHSSFMYNLVNASGTSVKSGNFATSKAEDTISLLTLSTGDGSLTTSLSTYTLYIYINGASGDNPSSMQNQSFDFTFDVTGSNSSRGYISNGELLVTKVESLDDGSTGDDGSGVYKVEHSAIASDSSATGNEIPAVTDYRYYGSSPDNYVCLDMNGESTCPDRSLYRIIGSIYEENAGENLIKVIKATPIVSDTRNVFCWTDNDNYNNNWPTSLLSTLLNNGSWWNSTTGSYRYNLGDITVNFIDKGLTNKAKKLINNSIYYLGGSELNTSETYTTAMYGDERGTVAFSDNSLKWEGKIGLMYPSDYGYAAGTSCATGIDLYSYGNSCKSSDWLFTGNHDWFITPVSGGPSMAFFVDSSNGGSVEGHYLVYDHTVSPVFYLTSDVSITSGTGTSTDPYIVTK